MRYEAPPLVRRFAPQVPAELEQTIQQLLKKDPEDRIPTALALTHRLQAMQHALLRTDATNPAVAAPEDAESSARDDATRVADDRGPPTEVAPTALDLSSV